MNKIYSLIALLLTVMILPGCEKENIFGNDDEGKLMQEVSFARFKQGAEVNTGEKIVRAAAAVDLNPFIVEVTGANGKTYYNGTFEALPEILTMPVGEGYSVSVHSPENPAAAWDTPYYAGSAKFDVKENEVTDVPTVVCTLANVKVSVVFDSSLLPLMESDCQVKVETGDGASLIFKKDETRSGFFRYEADGSDQATLVATFTGTVDENFEQNFRTYTSVAPGNHYIITYTLHGVEPDVPDQSGYINHGVTVDANVTREDLTVNITPDDPILPDTDRPTEGDKPVVPPVTGGNAPSVDLNEPVKWNTPNDVPADGMTVQVTVHSEHSAGITAFTVDIESDVLDADTLETVGLASHLDLVTPGKFEEGLKSLGFPVNVGGMQDPDVMDISQFTIMLSALGAGTHKFKVTVTDGYGTTQKTLILVTK
ncbi:MAG: DUF4493 domain-containing protein [Bacteroidales bacterium]|nr:DUF4493 domain-containing protein [Bacteroidales bacterium]